MELTLEKYRELDRHEKVRFLWGDVFETVEVEEARKRVTAFLVKQEGITAGEVAEAILLGNPHACYLYRGRIPESQIDDNWKALSRDIVDRAMRMADSWGDEAYEDCFSLLSCYATGSHPVAPALWGIAMMDDELAETLKASGCSEDQVAVIVAGGIAAQEAERALEFLSATEEGAAETTPQLAVIS